jgi:hypothetical protein
MKIKTIAKINGAFLACLIAVVLLLAHERTVGVLTPRELSIALIVYTVGSSILLVVVVILGRRSASRTLPGTATAPLHPAVRRQRLRVIRTIQVTIALLVISLLLGFFRFRSTSFWGNLLGITMNLLFTGVLVRMVIRLKNTLR